MTILFNEQRNLCKTIESFSKLKKKTGNTKNLLYFCVARHQGRERTFLENTMNKINILKRFDNVLWKTQLNKQILHVKN